MDAGQITPTPRRRPWRFIAVLLPGLAAPGCQKPAAGPVDFVREDWTYLGAPGSKLTSEHYVIYTTCKNKPLVDALPTFLEACWEAYAKLLPPTNQPQAPLETYLFQSRWHWERFTDEFAGPRSTVYKQIRSGGYSERGVSVSHYSTRRSTLSIMAHEGLHQYLEVTHGKPIPAWINEGLACYFESFDIGPDNRPIFVPESNTLRTPALREALRGQTLVPIETVLATDAGREIHKRSKEVLAYYAQTWSVVVFLLRPERGNPYRQGFLELLSELGTEQMDRKARAFISADTDGHMSYGEAVFRAYVTENMYVFEREYREWLSRLLSVVT